MLASGEWAVLVSCCIYCSAWTEVLSVAIKVRSRGEKDCICATVLMKL